MEIVVRKPSRTETESAQKYTPSLPNNPPYKKAFHVSIKQCNRIVGESQQRKKYQTPSKLPIKEQDMICHSGFVQDWF